MFNTVRIKEKGKKERNLVTMNDQRRGRKRLDEPQQQKIQRKEYRSGAHASEHGFLQ